MIIATGCKKTSAWGQMDNPKSLKKFIDAEKSEGRNLFSVAASDDFGFGAFTLKDFGTEQIIMQRLGLNDWWTGGNICPDSPGRFRN